MRIQAIIETAIYVDDLQAAETFYWTILGLRVMGRKGAHDANAESEILFRGPA